VLRPNSASPWRDKRGKQKKPEKKHSKGLGASTTLAYSAQAGMPSGPAKINPIRRGNRTLMATKKKPAAKKAAAKPAAQKPIKDVMSKSALIAHIAGATDVVAKDVRAVMAALEGTIHASIAKKGAGTFVLPGVLKITAVSVAAKPKRKGINPFTGQETTFAAKPATVKVKVRPMRKLKDAATA
jgi:nucleoid DNA-binding protein